MKSDVDLDLPVSSTNGYEVDVRGYENRRASVKGAGNEELSDDVATQLYCLLLTESKRSVVEPEHFAATHSVMLHVTCAPRKTGRRSASFFPSRVGG